MMNDRLPSANDIDRNGCHPAATDDARCGSRLGLQRCGHERQPQSPYCVCHRGADDTEDEMEGLS